MMNRAAMPRGLVGKRGTQRNVARRKQKQARDRTAVSVADLLTSAKLESYSAALDDVGIPSKAPASRLTSLNRAALEVLLLRAGFRKPGHRARLRVIVARHREREAAMQKEDRLHQSLSDRKEKMAAYFRRAKAKLRTIRDELGLRWRGDAKTCPDGSSSTGFGLTGGVDHTVADAVLGEMQGRWITAHSGGWDLSIERKGSFRCLRRDHCWFYGRIKPVGGIAVDIIIDTVVAKDGTWEHTYEDSIVLRGIYKVRGDLLQLCQPLFSNALLSGFDQRPERFEETRNYECPVLRRVDQVN